MTDTQADAGNLWRCGLSVIPVPRPRAGAPSGHPGDGKVPAMAWREYQTRLPTENEMARWFIGEPTNLAVVTGAVSGVVVVDADSPEALRWCTQRLDYTPWQTQTAKGFHLWYRYPGVTVRNRARIETRDGRLAIDVHGDGGYLTHPARPLPHYRIANALGIKYLVVRQKSTGKFMRVAALQAEKLKPDEEIIEVWEKDPSVQAFTDLLNRAIDKPVEQVDMHVSGELEIVAQRLVAARKRLVERKRDE